MDLSLILSLVAALLMLMNGFEFVHRVLWVTPLGIFDGLKTTVWMGTSLAVAFFLHWWPFLVRAVLVGILRFIQSSSPVLERAKRARHPFYFNAEVGYDAKFHRMFSIDKHFLFLYFFLHGVVMVCMLFVIVYLRKQYI
jgi:hypothetical protein